MTPEEARDLREIYYAFDGQIGFLASRGCETPISVPDEAPPI